MATISIKHEGKTLSTETNGFKADAESGVDEKTLYGYYKGSGWFTEYSYLQGYQECAKGHRLFWDGITNEWKVIKTVLDAPDKVRVYDNYTKARKYFTKKVKEVLIQEVQQS